MNLGQRARERCVLLFNVGKIAFEASIGSEKECLSVQVGPKY